MARANQVLRATGGEDRAGTAFARHPEGFCAHTELAIWRSIGKGTP